MTRSDITSVTVFALGAAALALTDQPPLAWALMGAAAARGAELVVITDDNPRSEDPASIRAAVAAGAQSVPGDERPAGADEVLEIGDRREAIAAAAAWARPGDIVVVAGKGHETGQEIDGVKHPFDDRVELAAAIDALRAGDVTGADR